MPSKNPSLQFKYLNFIAVTYVTVLLISNTTAGKIVSLNNFATDAATLFFPVVYIISDILTEVYGYAKARNVLWIVIYSQILMSLLYSLVVLMPPAVGFDANDSFIRVLSQVPRIVFGSLIAIFIGSILNDFILAKMKILTKGKHLWARTIGSTIIGQGADTVIFYLIAFYTVIPDTLLISSILFTWIIKVIIEIVLTPLTYFIINRLKKAENTDTYDTRTDFNPFILK